MNCPQCQRALSNAFQRCPHCDYAFTDEIYQKLRFYFSLKSEVSNLEATRGYLNEALEKISDQVKKYDELLNQELHRPGPSQLPVEKKEPARPSEPVPTPQAIPKPSPEPSPPPTHAAGMQATPSKARPEAQEARSDFEIRIGQKWSLIIGIVAVVFGVGYFLKFSFERGWIGPAARVALAYLLGAGLLAAGEAFRRRQLRAFGLNLVGGGIAVLYFATFAAFQFYQLLSQELAFFLMVIVTILAGALSVVYDAKGLAVLGIIGGFLTPIFLNTGQDNQIALMTYMTILNLGLLGIAFYRKWDLLNILGFISTYLLYSSWFFRHYANAKFWPAMLFLQVFYLIYIVAPFAYEFVTARHEKGKGLVILSSNSFVAFGFSYFMIKQLFSVEWVGVITLLYSAVFLLLASVFFKQGKHDSDAFFVLLGNAALFLIITVPIVLSRHWITIFWAAQALTLLWIGIRLNRQWLVAAGYLLMAVTTFKFLTYDYSATFRLEFVQLYFVQGYRAGLIERYVASVVVLAILYWIARMAQKSSLQVLSSFLASSKKDDSFLYAAWGVLLFIVLNVETASFFHDYLPPARFAAMSVLWTLFSASLMIKGFKDNLIVLRKVSLGLFGVTIIKVFLFDISRFSVPYRIVSFIILGAVLIVTSYLYYRFKDKIESAILGDRSKQKLT